MTQHYKTKQYDKDKILSREIIKLAGSYPRYGYRMITAKLRQAGWRVNRKRVQPIWRKEGLQVPYRHKFKKAKGNSDNSCSVKKAEYINHVWTYDFISDQTVDGKPLKLLTLQNLAVPRVLSSEDAGSTTWCTELTPAVRIPGIGTSRTTRLLVSTRHGIHDHVRPT